MHVYLYLAKTAAVHIKNFLLVRIGVMQACHPRPLMEPTSCLLLCARCSLPIWADDQAGCWCRQPLLPRSPLLWPPDDQASR